MIFVFFLVFDDFRKASYLFKKVDKRLSILGLIVAGFGFSSGEEDEYFLDGEEFDVVRK